MVGADGLAERRCGFRFLDSAEELAPVLSSEFIATNGTKYFVQFLNDGAEYIVNIYNGETFEHVQSINSGEDYDPSQVIQVGDALVVTFENHQPQEVIQFTNGEFSLEDIPFKNLPTFSFDNSYYDLKFKLSATAAGSATLTSSSAIFNSNHVGGLFIAAGKSDVLPFGKARITGFTSSTQVSLNIEIEFLNTSNKGSDSVLEEVAFSDTRGWPTLVTFYQDRLVFAKTSSLIHTIFASKIGDYTNFDVNIGQDSDAIVERIQTVEHSEILHLVSARTLQIFTTDGIYNTLQQFGQAWTPTTSSIAKFSDRIASLVPPIVFGQEVFFVRRDNVTIEAYPPGPNVNEEDFFVINLQNKSDFTSINRLRSFNGNANTDSKMLVVLDQQGCLFLWQYNKQQQINAWSIAMLGSSSNLKTITPSRGISDIYKVEQEIYIFIYSDPEVSIQHMAFEKIYLDTYIKNATSVPLSLRNVTEQLYGIKDGKFIGPIPENYTGDAITIGTKMPILFSPLPPSIPNSSSQFKKLRTNYFNLQYYESLGIKVNGTEIPDTSFSDIQNDEITLKSGVFKTPLLGWDQNKTPEITSDLPYPITIQALGYDVVEGTK